MMLPRRHVKKATTRDEVNAILRGAMPKVELKNIVGYTEEELVSSDFKKSPYSSIIDSKLNNATAMTGADLRLVRQRVGLLVPPRRRDRDGARKTSEQGLNFHTSFERCDELDVRGKRVVVREDLNVPMKDGEVADPTRIVAALRRCAILRDRGARTIVLSHSRPPRRQGRPAKYSLRPVAAELAQRLGMPVAFADDCVGPVAREAVAALRDGDVVLLENVRFHAEEERTIRLRARTGGARRPLRQRRVRHGAPRARLDRRDRARSAGRGGTS
jgi:hypothetical protein